jgi:hypothetical protein
MKTITNAAKFDANEETGDIAVTWTAECYDTGRGCRVDLFRNGHEFGTVKPTEVMSCLMNCVRAQRAPKRTAGKLLRGVPASEYV